MMEPKFLAPTYTYKRASHLIFSRITKVGELLFLKTLAFLSFQISQTSCLFLKFGVSRVLNGFYSVV
jgi:hypothetical protein